MKKVMKYVFMLAVLTTVFVSCKKDEEIPDGKGEVSVKLTDASFPFGFVAEANVGVTKVELKNADGEYVTVFEASSSANTSYNLLDYTNGATATVETQNIDPGVYSRARVTFDAVSVHMNGSIDGEGEDTVFDLSSGLSSSYEVSIDPALEVEEGEHSDVLFDIDANSAFSFHTSIIGEFINLITDITGCSLTLSDQSIRVCDLDQTGAISGKVTVNGSAEENVLVQVNVNGHTLTTHTKSDGTYTFIGVKEGEYTVKVTTSDNEVHQTSVTVTGTETGTCDFSII